MIFWKFWSWPSYNIECLLYWLRWHLVVETSLLTVKKPKSVLPYFQWWMLRHVGTLHWSYSSGLIDYENSLLSGFITQHTPNTDHCLQLRMSGQFWSMSWKYWHHSDIRPCGWPRGIQSHCITLSQRTMTRLITWMAWCELWLGRKLKGKKTCSSRWSSLDRSCQNTMPKWLQRRACI
jgi:hypothetical protein